jgi:hypothetical protein
MNLAKLSPRVRRFTLKRRRQAKRQLPTRLAAYRRRQHQQAIAAKRPHPPRWLQRQERLIDREIARLQAAEQAANFAASKPTFEE